MQITCIISRNTDYHWGRDGSDNNDGIFGNEESAVCGIPKLQTTQLTPYLEGYYLEFKTAGVGEYYFNTGVANLICHWEIKRYEIRMWKMRISGV